MAAAPFIPSIEHKWGLVKLATQQQWLGLTEREIVLVLTTIVWAMVAIYPHAKWITYIQIPYLLWVSFATVLQLTITYLNR